MHAPNSNEGYPKRIFQFGHSIRVSVAQPNDHITICVDPHNCRPKIGSISLSIVQCQQPMKIKDTPRPFINMEVKFGF
jgi:hypothetical protein